MLNKVMVVLLIVLLCLTGGVGYYSYTLNQRVDDLSARLTGYESEQALRLAGISENLTALGSLTASGLNALQGGINAVQSQVDNAAARITAQESGLVAARESIATAEVEISNAESRIQELSANVSSIASTQTGLTKGVLDANKVYGIVSRSTVRITNGQSTIGSGFIYDTGGHVVTAFHVIDGLSPIYVVMYDGSVSTATVAGSSPASDIGVLKLAVIPSAPPVSMGDSSLVKIGEPVVAIGSPLDIRDTATAGIISRTNRYTDYGLASPVPNLLQFDAPVNPGNSGGPLANAAGEIIGVVVARIQAAQGDGIYYAVSSDKVKKVADEVITNGSFAYPWIGVNIGDITPQQAEEMSLATTYGVLVSSVVAGQPAEAAGIRAGDVIVTIDGVPVRDTGELTSYLGENKSPGETTTIEVIRGAERLNITVTVGTRPS
ncbi:MAG: hypothetical protein A2Z29_08235 [Chloroflexi bacterium RBG_16_56_11]|nr:MAG: hypothetical protein A2Z29_08235 [Chloroflexi bacterium RBG_16_56_11]